MGILNSQSLDLVAHGSDLASQLAGIVGGDAGGDDSTADTTGSAKVHLATNVDVGNWRGKVSLWIISRLQGGLPFLSSQRRGRSVGNMLVLEDITT
jgi:hypothetical protein